MSYLLFGLNDFQPPPLLVRRRMLVFPPFLTKIAFPALLPKALLPLGSRGPRPNIRSSPSGFVSGYGSLAKPTSIAHPNLGSGGRPWTNRGLGVASVARGAGRDLDSGGRSERQGLRNQS
jgi:hypothetical protein